MEINEKKLKSILGEQKQDFQKHVDKTVAKERAHFQKHVDKTVLKERAHFQKHVDKTAAEQRKEFQNYVGVLKEDFDGKIQLIAEIVSGIQEQLIAIRDMVVKNSDDIEIMKMEMFAVKGEVKEMRKDIEVIKSDIVFIKTGLKKKVDFEEFEALEKRVAILEARK